MNVYLDNAATTRIHPKVVEKMTPFMNEEYGNPSSVHSLGRKARVAIEEARETVANFINAKPGEIYFVSSGTEANNFVLQGTSRSEYEESRRNHIITTKSEHHSVLDTVENLDKQGYRIDYADINENTSLNITSLENLICDSTSLISVIHINNETGSINNLNEIKHRLNGKNIFLHTDAVQSFGKSKIDVQKLGIDSLSASGHKIYGPKGIGIVYVKSGKPISSMIYGGSQERNRRAGTENVSGIVGFAEAVRIAETEMEENKNLVKNIREELLNGIENLDKEGIAFTCRNDGSPYILSITFKNEFYFNDAESMLMFLDINGIAASSGSACSSGTLNPSHVIINSGRSEMDATGTIRLSFSPAITQMEVDYTLEVFKKLVEKFRK
jgi:cysteine desulfurase